MNTPAPATWFTLDTATMPLEEVPGNPGMGRRTLLEVSDSPGFARIVYGPAGFSSNVQSLLEHGVHRHYHRSVTERHYILAGDYPIWHWIDATREGALTRLRRHHYLENPPHTLHGIVPGSVPETGYGIVQWTDGFGTELFEPGADTETITVAPDTPVTPAELRQPICFHAEDRPWTAHASIEGWKVRELGAETPTCPAARLVNVPPDLPLSSAAAPPPVTASRWQWLLLISGDLNVDVRAGADEKSLTLKEGGFLAWRQGAAIAIDPSGPSAGGAVVLCVGHDLNDSGG